jgi:hypothetical protein
VRREPPLIAEFEQRLADVLGQRMPAPFQGNVSRVPGPGGSQARLLLGVGHVEPLSPDFGSVRPEVVPAGPDQRRVLRLRCDVRVIVEAPPAQGRAQQVDGLDAALYLLDAPDLRDGTALIEEGDQGFLIESLLLGAAEGLTTDEEVIGVTLEASGWFWPVGVEGAAGIPMGPILVRSALLPVGLEPPLTRVEAGGDPIALTVRTGLAGTFVLDEPAPAEPTSPFGALVVALVGPGGTPGAGTLSGGEAGSGGSRLVPVADDAAAVTYTPPAEPARETLVVSAVSGDPPRIGIELARFEFRVEAP